MSKVDKFPKPFFMEPSIVETPALRPGAFASMDEPCWYYDPYPKKVFVPGKLAGSISFTVVSEVPPLDLRAQYDDAPQRIPFTSSFPSTQIIEALRSCRPLPQSISVSHSMFASLISELPLSAPHPVSNLTIIGVRVICDPRVASNEIWVNP